MFYSSWKTVLKILKKLKILLLYDPAIPYLEVCPPEVKLLS
jgi:hypothetical protein